MLVAMEMELVDYRHLDNGLGVIKNASPDYGEAFRIVAGLCVWASDPERRYRFDVNLDWIIG